MNDDNILDEYLALGNHYVWCGERIYFDTSLMDLKDPDSHPIVKENGTGRIHRCIARDQINDGAWKNN
jgi:hypothetical protein